MSTVIILAPVIIGSWPAIAGAAGAAAAYVGLHAKESIEEAIKNTEEEEVEHSIEMELAEETGVAENLSEDQQLEFSSEEGIKLVVKRDERGKCSICASGKGFSDEELREKAEQFTEKFTQCYVYNKVVSELKNKKFQIVDQKVEDDQSIRINVRKWTD
ncbi:MAG: DUF1257 domain-containing protein [Sedimentisphaeraceae bacterium JB056]